MKFKSLVILATFSLASPALANSNTPVTESYQSFKNAIQIENYDAAAMSAYTAWQEAEAHFGDHPTTSVLAQNYANLHYNIDLDHDKVIEAYFRAIELAILPEDKRRQAKVLARYALKTNNAKIKRQIVTEFKNRFGKNNSAFLDGYDPYAILGTVRENPATLSSGGRTSIR